MLLSVLYIHDSQTNGNVRLIAAGAAAGTILVLEPRLSPVQTRLSFFVNRNPERNLSKVYTPGEPFSLSGNSLCSFHRHPNLTCSDDEFKV